MEELVGFQEMRALFKKELSGIFNATCPACRAKVSLTIEDHHNEYLSDFPDICIFYDCDCPRVSLGIKAMTGARVEGMSRREVVFKALSEVKEKMTKYFSEHDWAYVIERSKQWAFK